MGLTQKLGTIPLAIFTDASNNIGIGGSPSGSYKFEVTGASKMSGFLGVNGSPATSFPFEAYINSSTAYSSTSRGNVLRVYNSNTGANVFAGIELGGAGTANDGLAGINGIVTGSGSAALSFYTRDGGTFAERVRVAANGNVGIGSNNPGYPLIISRTLSSEQTLLNIDNATNTQNNFGMNFSVLGYLPVAAIRVIYPAENNLSLAFFTYNGAGNVNERMRITQVGRVGIGMTAPADLLSVSDNSPSMSLRYTSAGTTSTPVQANFYFRDFTGSGDIRGGIYFQDQSQSTSGCNMLLRVMNNSNTIITSINMRADGSVWNFNNSTTWQQSSDIKIKENIRPIGDALGKICALNPTHFEYKNKLGKTKTGFIAQEFEQVFAGHVTESYPSEEYAEYFEEGEMMKSIDADLIPYLVKAIQELSAKVSALENKS
jgi:hypothetical protein